MNIKNLIFVFLMGLQVNNYFFPYKLANIKNLFMGLFKQENPLSNQVVIPLNFYSDNKKDNDSKKDKYKGFLLVPNNYNNSCGKNITQEELNKLNLIRQNIIKNQQNQQNEIYKFKKQILKENNYPLKKIPLFLYKNDAIGFGIINDPIKTVIIKQSLNTNNIDYLNNMEKEAFYNNYDVDISDNYLNFSNK